MAKKKTDAVEEVKAEEKVEAKTEKKTEAVDYYEEKVPIFIPLIDGEAGDMVVGHNGIIYKIKRGQEVMVPRKLAIIIQNSNAQAVAMREFSESIKNQELNA